MMASCVVVPALTGNLQEMFKEKEKANDILRYLISVSRGYQFKSPARVRFSVLLRLKDDLERLGALWQVARADNWINLFLKHNKDVLQNDPVKREGGGVYNSVVVNSNKPYFEKPDFEKPKFEKKDFEKGNCGGVSYA